MLSWQKATPYCTGELSIACSLSQWPFSISAQRKCKESICWCSPTDMIWSSRVFYKPFKAQTHFHPDFRYHSAHWTILSFTADAIWKPIGATTHSNLFSIESRWRSKQTWIKLPIFWDKHYGAFAIANGAPANFKSISNYKPATAKHSRYIHLKSHLDDELEPPGNITTVYLMGTIGVFIILIAALTLSISVPPTRF